MKAHLSFLAGVDYGSVEAAVLFFDSATRSAEFSVNILPDSLTELTEFFEGILTGVVVLDGSFLQVSLSAQERDRVRFSPQRALVNILDGDSKSIMFWVGYYY